MKYKAKQDPRGEGRVTGSIRGSSFPLELGRCVSIDYVSIDYSPVAAPRKGSSLLLLGFYFADEQVELKYV